ncbi:MAG: hypothetical protein AAGF54_05225 [Pseudomonadota bacterium]
MSQAILSHERVYKPEVIIWIISASMFICFALTLVLAVFDDRTIDGVVSVWAKPLKFEISLAIHAATLALVMAALNPSVRVGKIMTVLSVAFLAACIVEMSYIIAQAARGEHSHFNVSTPFNRFMWSVMAIAAVVIVGAAGVIGTVMIFGSKDGLAPALKWAIVSGLVGGTLLTIYTAFSIGANNSPYVGGVPTNRGERMLLTGWSLIAGDIRVSHFLATHMIQVLPVVGLAISRVAPGRNGLIIVLVFALAWSTFTIMEYGRALGGNSSTLAISIGL